MRREVARLRMTEEWVEQWGSSGRIDNNTEAKISRGTQTNLKHNIYYI